MKLSYLIQAHKNEAQLKVLVDTLNSEASYFYIHIDRKTELKRFVETFETYKNVYLFDDNERIDVFWGSFSLIEATLLMLKKVEEDKRSGYCLFISGQDFPLVSKEKIFTFFEENNGINFISGINIYNPDYPKESFEIVSRRILNYNFQPVKNTRYNYSIPSILDKRFYGIKTLKTIIRGGKYIKYSKLIHKKQFPSYLEPYKGSNWWALPVETTNFILNFLKEHPDYIDFYTNYCHCGDEFFFNSIIHTLFPKDKIKPCITYVNWLRQGVSLPITFSASDEDKEELLAVKDKLFARKFDFDIDKEIVEILRKRITD